MLARGARAAEHPRSSSRIAAQRDKLAARFPGAIVHPQCDAAAIAGAELIVFAVKPQQMREAARAARAAPRAFASRSCCPSPPASARPTSRAGSAGIDRIVRAMPNTPALIGKGISGVHAAEGVDAAGRARCAAVLEAAGEIVWVADEAMLDAVTGVSGSGPAYVFYFLEALQRAARELGFSADDARRLAYATFDGAIALAKASAEDPATLRAQVTSKGGTTERALAVMAEGDVEGRIVAAVKAAAERARELGDDSGKD